MKTFILTLSCIISFQVLSQGIENTEKPKKNKNNTGWDNPYEFPRLPNIVQETPPGMILIEGGVHTMNQLPEDVFFSDKDSLVYKPKRKNTTKITVPTFLLSENEVTNEEYREFTNWVKVRRAMDILAENYPSRRLPNGNYNEDIQIDWNDPILLKYFYLPQKDKKGNYQINTELLFFEYKQKQFYEDDSLGRTDNLEKIRILIYPDTTCWTKEYKNQEKWGSTDFIRMSKIDSVSNYFCDNKFDKYPVVGVSWIQANAFCKWKSDRINEYILLREEILKKKSYYFTTEKYLEPVKSEDGRVTLRMEDGILLPNFRLPTEAEWEFAAKFITISNKNISYYPWKDNLLKNKKGKYYSNFGKILDQNGLLLKTFIDDGYLFTSPVGSFEGNQCHLNDMSGNVSEWVIDEASAFYYENGKYSKLVKGGSWADSPLYLMHGNTTFFFENSSSARIGFRVAMDYNGSPSAWQQKKYRRKIDE
jgi:sulfatase modifying factor 1